MSSSKATLVFDDGPKVGLGHRRRMEVLHGALDALGFSPELRPLRTNEHIYAGVLIVDSYVVQADDTSRFTADYVVAIEDLERDVDVDLVVALDPGADPTVYTKASHVLTGAHYSLVDPRLRGVDTLPIGNDVRRILVTTGGADAAGIGALLASMLATVQPDVEIRYVVGPWGEPGNDPRVHLVHAPDGLTEELAAADIVVTAGGVTMLEACCLGRPTVAMAIAPNQRPAVAGAPRVGAVLAADAASGPDIASRLVGNRDLRVGLSASARALVDGQGATRVAAAIATIASHGTHSR